MKFSLYYGMLQLSLLLLLLLHGALAAGPIILTFEEEGLPPVSVGDFYNGGGGPAVNYGIYFNDAAPVRGRKR